MLNITLRKKARQFTKLVRHSAMTPRTGYSRHPVLANNGELGLTFIGHSSFFVQIGGKNIVIDPNFAQWLFILKRLRRPGVKVKDLPPIDAVLVTHAHFDHLHRPSLRALVRVTRRKRRAAPAIIVPRLVGDLVSDLGFREVIEIGWWETLDLNGVQVIHTPSRHWGARVLRDMHRGYGGYVLKGNGQSLYHAGDTAYFEGFREIGHRLRPEVALLPIGAYHPPSFRNVHTSPEDAVQAFIDLGSRWMVPMHYGTFRLSHEPMDEPLQRLADKSSATGVDDRVVVLEEGATHFF
ncbi:MAG TPA: MBL fold metallo-hydrolase [Terriglobales bacterium]|nr:MBL fold metallo-hydrolase [Terriglobales bacterium]